MHKYLKILNYVIIMYYFFATSVAFADTTNNQDNSTNVILTKSSDISNDIILKTKILTTYSLNPELNKFNLNVDVNQGIVHLDGAIQNSAQKDLAITIAKNVEGVKDVTDSLVVDKTTKAGEVSTEYAQKIADATLTAMVKSKLLLNPKTSGFDIKVTTVNNIVTLSGEVDSKLEKELAGRITIKTLGVDSVKNNIKVRGTNK